MERGEKAEEQGGEGGEGEKEEGREYEPSVHVKTVLKPHERTRASDSVRVDIVVVCWGGKRMDGGIDVGC